MSSLACTSDRIASNDNDDHDDESADGSAEVPLAEDEQLCLDWCLSADETPCGAVTCYSGCMKRLENQAGQRCEGEGRAVLACEAAAEQRTEFNCESLECVDEYKRHDLCRGSCSHLGGWPGSGSSPSECRWRSGCYGHEFEAKCSTGGITAVCECYVDAVLIEQCEQPESLVAFACDPELHVLTTCCGSLFEGVLFP
jgi:hypothetical protein